MGTTLFSRGLFITSALAGAIVGACSSEYGGAPVGAGTTGSGSATPEVAPPDTPKESPSSAMPSQTAPDASAADGASSGSGGTNVSDAAADAHGVLLFAAPCLLSAQCSTGLCLPFKDKGLRCTKACKNDDDCPKHKDCGDSPRVCDID